MADEVKTPETTPPVETAPPAAPPAESPKTPSAEPSKTPEAAPPKEVSPPLWATHRIDVLTRQKRELEERLTALERSGEKREAPKDVPGGKPALTQNQLDEMVNRRAAEIRFAERCQDVYNKGKSEFSDFEQVLGTYSMIGGLQPSVVEIALELGDAHKILYNLAKDPNEAHAIMQMSPAAQAAKLAKLSFGPPKSGTKAPPPVQDEVGGGSTKTTSEGLDDTNISMEEWIRRREAGLKKSA